MHVLLHRVLVMYELVVLLIFVVVVVVVLHMTLEMIVALMVKILGFLLMVVVVVDHSWRGGGGALHVDCGRDVVLVVRGRDCKIQIKSPAILEIRFEL